MLGAKNQFPQDEKISFKKNLFSEHYYDFVCYKFLTTDTWMKIRKKITTRSYVNDFQKNSPMTNKNHVICIVKSDEKKIHSHILLSDGMGLLRQVE